MRRLLLALFALLLPSTAIPVLAAPVLERVVLVSRHGVRPPTRSNAELAAYSEAPWPQWPVEPGVLTPHGAEALIRMGEGLKQNYAALQPGCGVFIWSDGADSRTRDSAAILAVEPGLALADRGLTTATGLAEYPQPAISRPQSAHWPAETKCL